MSGHSWFVVFTCDDADGAKKLHRALHPTYKGSHIYRDDQLIIDQKPTQLQHVRDTLDRLLKEIDAKLKPE